MTRRRGLFIVLWSVVGAMLIVAALPQTGQHIYEAQECYIYRGEQPPCPFPPFVYNILELGLAAAALGGVLMLRWGLKQEDKRKDKKVAT